MLYVWRFFHTTRRLQLVNYTDVTSVKVELQSCKVVLLCTLEM